MKRIFLLMAFAAVASCEAPPKTLDEQLNRDNPRVIAFLQSLPSGSINQPVKGVRLSDGTVELKGSTFLGSRHLAAKRQHFYLFNSADGFRAYVWVDPGGAPLPIPAVRGDSSGENAYVLSGDVYTFSEVHPGDGVVVLCGADPDWLRKQK